MRFDSLTVEHWHRLQPYNWGCDCHAPEMACHRHNCSITPIYADLVDKLGVIQPWPLVA